MRLFVAGSAPLLPATFDRWRERTGHTILERYGMSETVMLTSNPCHAREGERRAGTVGFPLPGVQLRIRDQNGGPCPRGEAGGIEVRGPSVFKGYWRAPALTEPGTSPDPAALIAELKTRIANFKVPKRVFVADELPRNVMGKVQKAILRHQHKELF